MDINYCCGILFIGDYYLYIGYKSSGYKLLLDKQ
jgi:hypothetical protein